VAFGLSSVALLPLLSLILFAEWGWLSVDPETQGQLFSSGVLSNRQLQLASMMGSGWALLLAIRTRTTVLGSMFIALTVLTAVTLMAEVGLSDWLRDGRWDLLAMHLSVLVPITALAGHRAEARGHAWLGLPAYISSAVLGVIALELLALDGRAFHHLGISMVAGGGPDVSNPLLLDTATAMTLNGMLVYAAAALIDRRGSVLMRPAAQLLFTIAPFAMLEPVAWLVLSGEYSIRYDWLYLALAVTIAFLSHHRQRKSFYYAGLCNTGLALALLSQHNEWLDVPPWATAVLSGGLALLLIGAVLDRLERWGAPTSTPSRTP
jgi:hypothetical protein